MGHSMLSPWQTDVQQCTSACAIEEVIVHAMCRQLPANADGEFNATCRLLHGEATSERGGTSAKHANVQARASPQRKRASEAPLRLKAKRRRANATARRP